MVHLVEAGNETPGCRSATCLSSDRFATEFVVETEDDGTATCASATTLLGRAPARRLLTATYRVGNGQAGNVGAEAIGHVVTDVDGIRAVRNPLPATGGTEPERSSRCASTRRRRSGPRSAR